MNIVQTLWTSDRSLFNKPFGWITPQHHLMAWALSSLKIKEFYSELHLYTDSQGEDIFINKLQLPYTKVIKKYDKLQINPALWATPKILTYSYQQKPFIHVDGDVFIWERFSSEIEKAALVAQNVERGTDYYGNLMIRLTESLNYIPNQLTRELRKKSISSINAGILGGNDLAFFKYYTQNALKLIDRNKDSLDINFNILFEQILFVLLYKEKGLKISCQFRKKYDDGGYTFTEFADFTRIKSHKTYLHLIGPHKKNKHVCHFLARTLLSEYPEYYYKIVNLFKEKHIHYTKFCSESRSHRHQQTASLNLFNNIKSNRYERCVSFIHAIENKAIEIKSFAFIKNYVNQSPYTALKSLYKYESKIHNLVYKWAKLDFKELINLERHPAYISSLITASRKERGQMRLRRNPFLHIIATSHDWTLLEFPVRKEQIESIEIPTDIICIPELFFKGYSEISIDDTEYNILALLDSPIRFDCLLNRISLSFSKDKSNNDKDSIYKLILLKVKRLADNKCIYIESKSL